MRMKVILAFGALLVRGLRYPEDQVYKKQKTIDKFRFSNDNPRPQVPRSKEHLWHAVSPGGMFEFDIDSIVHPSKLLQFASALQIAGGFIENAISLKQKVTAKVRYGDVCGQVVECKPGEILDVTRPNTRVEFMPNKEFVEYPYALLNQKRTFKKKGEFDMTINIQYTNTHVNPEDYGSLLNNQALDTIEIIVHEILHGLGFFTSITNSNDDPFYVGPPYRTMDKDSGPVWFLKSVFDTHLHAHNASLHEVLLSMDFLKRRTAEAGPFIQAIPNMPQILKINELFKTNQPIYFQTANDKVFLHTSSDPDERSISHLSDMHYRASLDHIMIPGTLSYHEILQQRNLTQGWLTAPLGANIVDMLETLGYQRNPSPQRSRSQLAFYDEMQVYFHPAS